jgi:hypothetical protein
VRQLSETEIIKLNKMNKQLEFIKRNDDKTLDEIQGYLYKTKETELSDSENLFYLILNDDFTNKTDAQLIGMSSLLSAFIDSYTLDSSFFREKLKSIQKVQQLRQEKYS